jgi:hypothetical protein
VKNYKRNLTFNVRAYRKLTVAEMKQALSVWLRQSRRKTLPKNQTVTVISIHGFDG